MTKVIYKWLNDWFGFILALVIVCLYIYYVAQPSEAKTTQNTVMINILFALINLGASIYIARKVSIWGWSEDNKANQKKIAKTAIRHNRSNLASLLRLAKITSERTEQCAEPLIRQYFIEINHHIETIFQGIRNSESDFNEIVNDELVEQGALEFEIVAIMKKIEEQNNTIQQLSGETLQKQEEINLLAKKLANTEEELNKKLLKLPFGYPIGLGPTGPGINIQDFDINQLERLQPKFPGNKQE